MQMSDFTKGTAWGIVPDQYESLFRQVLDLRKSNDFSAQVAGFTPKKPEKGYRVQDNVAVVKVHGPISKQTSFFSFFFGGTSLDRLSKVFTEAIEDPEASAVLLDIDSPGGTIGGLEAFSDLVYSSRGEKPIVAFANGMMASAAYWIGSAADTIVAESTAEVGSIGVLMVHYDWSQNDAKYGLKRTFLSAGKYKALGNDAEPLSEEARRTFQAELDYLYDVFAGTVARNRGVDVGTVLEGMADGRIFIGQQAKDAGLVDSIGSMDVAIEAALSMVSNTSTSYQINFNSSGVAPEKEVTMPGEKKMDIPQTVEQLAVALPELAEALRAEGEKRVDLKTARKEAAQAENDRILGIAAVQFGDEAGEKFKAVVATGVTVDQFKAIRGTAPADTTSTEAAGVQKVKGETLAAIQEAGAGNPGTGDNTATGSDGDKDFMTLVEDHRAQHKCGQVEAMQAVMKKNPKVHAAYISSMN
jgi:signal peptide peptidase SppA